MNPSKQIDNRIKSLNDWRGILLLKIRKIILTTNSNITEEWKWNTPIWSLNGMICAGGAFKDHVKINFFKGASLQDTDKLFNAGLDAKTTRAIDLYEKDTLNEKQFKKLLLLAIKFNKENSK